MYILTFLHLHAEPGEIFLCLLVVVLAVGWDCLPLQLFQREGLWRGDGQLTGSVEQ